MSFIPTILVSELQVGIVRSKRKAERAEGKQDAAGGAGRRAIFEI